MKVSRSVVVKIFITHDKLLSHYLTYFYVTLQHSNRIRNAGEIIDAILGDLHKRNIFVGSVVLRFSCYQEMK